MQLSSAAILVLGDLNRSPRMLNHCAAISKTFPEIKQISLIGFQGGDLRSDISSDKKIKVFYIPEKINNYLKKLPKIFFILSALIRIIMQLFFLTYILLFKIPKPNFLILQNPPGIPAIYICSIICFMRRTTFIIDWHNYGYTILEVNNRHWIIVAIARLFEKIYGKCAHINFTVSNAMVKNLKDKMSIDAINLPDLAMKNVFSRLDLKARHQIFQKYDQTKNIFTEEENNIIKIKKNSPLFMLSSTSWTPDEDFDLLLDAFKITEIKLTDELGNIPKVIFIITGKGPMKDEYFKKINNSMLKLFQVKSIWLESDDYPKLLGSADLGVCLHYSSSGFDLPMKIVDMFSAQLPVAAFNYETIKELVKEHENGYLFKNADELSKIFCKVLMEYGKNSKCNDIDKYRENLKDFNKNDWINQWDNLARKKISAKIKLKDKLY